MKIKIVVNILETMWKTKRNSFYDFYIFKLFKISRYVDMLHREYHR